MPSLTLRELFRFVLASRHATLLFCLLLTTALYPMIEGRHVGRLLLDVFISLVFLSTLLAAAGSRRVLVMAAMAVVPALVLVWLGELVGAHHGARLNWLATARDLATLLFLGFAALVLLASVMSATEITYDSICGAVAVYILLGLSWAYLYALIEHLGPGSFSLAERGAEASPAASHRDLQSELTYHSFVTLTTLGYGDITPESGAARTFSWLEALAGQLYLAVLLARLVALYSARSSTGRYGDGRQ